MAYAAAVTHQALSLGQSVMARSAITMATIESARA